MRVLFRVDVVLLGPVSGGGGGLEAKDSLDIDLDAVAAGSGSEDDQANAVDRPRCCRLQQFFMLFPEPTMESRFCSECVMLWVCMLVGTSGVSVSVCVRAALLSCEQ